MLPVVREFDRRLDIARREILKQHPVDEHVATAELPEENAIGSVIQEMDIIPGSTVVTEQPKTEQQMLEARTAARFRPNSEPENQPDRH
jgi:hypothetical protein